MILDDFTLNILKNFSTINPSVYVKPGNVITTVNRMESMFGRATVPNTFEKEFAILEVSRFLSAYSIFKKTELEFGDKYIEIRNAEGKNKIKYTLSAPNAVKAKPDLKMSIKALETSFQIPIDLFKQLDRAHSVLQSDEIVFYTENGRLKIKAHNAKNSAFSVYEWEVCDSEPLSQHYRIDVANLNAIMPDDYTVNLDKRGIVNFSKPNLDYYILLKASKND